MREHVAAWIPPAGETVVLFIVWCCCGLGGVPEAVMVLTNTRNCAFYAQVIIITISVSRTSG